MTSLWRPLWRLALPAGLFCAAAASGAESTATLICHVQFAPMVEGIPIGATDKVSQRTLEVRHAVRAVATRIGHAVEFAGHPGQGVLLGAMEIRPPVTLALWVRRSGSPQADPAGARHPEYSQEHRDGLGRILSPLTGTPRDAGGQSGVLRLGPDGMSVWHGPDKWSPVVAHRLPPEEWVHLVVTFGTDLIATGYLNGQARGTTRSDFNLGPGPVALAAAALDRGFGYPFAGSIADVRIFRGILDRREIEALARLRPDP